MCAPLLCSAWHDISQGEAALAGCVGREPLGACRQRAQQEGILVAHRQLHVARQNAVQTHAGCHLAGALCIEYMLLAQASSLISLRKLWNIYTIYRLFEKDEKVKLIPKKNCPLTHRQ